MRKKKDRFILNHEVAKQVAKEYFPDCLISAFNPDWRLESPTYIFLRPSGDTFDIPDFIMGQLAEKLGLTWLWEKTPGQLRIEYEARQQYRKNMEAEYKKWCEEQELLAT